MTQFDKERQFFPIFFPRILNKTVFFLRQPDRLDFLLLTFQNVKNSPVFGDIIRPKNGLQTHTFNSKRKYPIHRNNLYDHHAVRSVRRLSLRLECRHRQGRFHFDECCADEGRLRFDE